MDDLFNVIEKVLPILIFIFWIVFSIVAANRKKSKGQPSPSQSTKTNQPKQRQQSQQSISMHEREKSSESASQPTNTVNDLKRKLESVFGELTFDSKTNIEEYERPIEKKVPYIPEGSVENVPLETVPLEKVRYLAQSRAETKKADDLDQQRIYGEAVYEQNRMESE